MTLRGICVFIFSISPMYGMLEETKVNRTAADITQLALNVQSDDICCCAICEQPIQSEKKCTQLWRYLCNTIKVLKCSNVNCIALCHPYCLEHYLKENRDMEGFKCRQCHEGIFFDEGGFCCNLGNKWFRIIGNGVLLVYSVSFAILFFLSDSAWDNLPTCPPCNTTENITGPIICRLLAP